MCLGMNPDKLRPGERCASTSNRNFEGRQDRAGAPTSSPRHGRCGGRRRPLRRYPRLARLRTPRADCRVTLGARDA